MKTPDEKLDTLLLVNLLIIAALIGIGGYINPWFILLGPALVVAGFVLCPIIELRQEYIKKARAK